MSDFKFDIKRDLKRDFKWDFHKDYNRDLKVWRKDKPCPAGPGACFLFRWGNFRFACWK